MEFLNNYCQYSSRVNTHDGGSLPLGRASRWAIPAYPLSGDTPDPEEPLQPAQQTPPEIIQRHQQSEGDQGQWQGDFQQ